MNRSCLWQKHQIEFDSRPVRPADASVKAERIRKPSSWCTRIEGLNPGGYPRLNIRWVRTYRLKIRLRHLLSNWCLMKGAAYFERTWARVMILTGEHTVCYVIWIRSLRLPIGLRRRYRFNRHRHRRASVHDDSVSATEPAWLMKDESKINRRSRRWIQGTTMRLPSRAWLVDSVVVINARRKEWITIFLN